MHSGMTWPILAVLAITWLGTFGCGGSLGRNLFGKKPESRSLDQIRPLAGNPEALLRNAHYFQLMGRPDLAVRELEEACRLTPHNLGVVNALARSYEELGKFEQARQVYQEALNRQGVHPGLQNNLCFSYYQEGKWQEAEACFRQTLARNPGNPAARNNLGLLLCRLGRPEEARRLWREAEGEAVAQAMLNQAREALGSPVSFAQASPAAGPKPSAAAKAKSSPAPVQSAAKDPETAPTPGPQVAALAPKPEKPAVSKAAKSPEAAAPGDSPAPAAKAVSQAAAGSKKLTRPSVAAAAKSSPGQVQSSAKLLEPAVGPAPQVAAAASAPKKPAAPALVRPRLTSQELLDTRILVVNGAGIPQLAHLYRTLLSDEGFHVGRIGNHFDFGAENTTIYYLPEAEKVAQALQAEHFPQSRMASKDKLPPGAQIKLVLGHDLEG